MPGDDSSSKPCLDPTGSGDLRPVSPASVVTLHPRPGRAGPASGVYPALAPADAEQGLEAERERERRLVEAVRRREPQAGERLYDELVGVVDRAIARTLGAGQPEHDDLVQATFEQLVVGLAQGRFRHECSLRSWASSIASHLALNAIRSRRRERALFDRKRSLHDEAFEAVGPRCTERDVEGRRKLARLRQELAAMSEERAHALVLHHVLGHDLKEVALLLGISLAAAQSRVIRGKNELQARLTREEEDGGGDG